MKRTRKIHCPTKARFKGDLVGCGSTNVVGPDEEGLYDCCNCGLFFTKRAAASHVKRAPISECIRSMERKVAQSHNLWRSVNASILAVLKSRKSQPQMIATLLKIAGPKKPNEPSSLGNFRSAARQLKRGEVVWVL